MYGVVHGPIADGAGHMQPGGTRKDWTGAYVQLGGPLDGRESKMMSLEEVDNASKDMLLDELAASGMATEGEWRLSELRQAVIEQICLYTVLQEGK